MGRNPTILSSINPSPDNSYSPLILYILVVSLQPINKINNRFNIIQVMYLSTEYKADIFAKHGKGATDTGSAEGQVALFTSRIAHLTGHLKKNKKDFSTQLSLQKLVGKRRALLAYLYKKDINRYRAIIKALELRDIIK
jgi:small subunit ribosomal protein S15